MPKTKLLKDKDNRVTIRVWRASIERGQVGHVSLETSEVYVSLWPYRNPRSGNPGFWKQREGVPSICMPNPAADTIIQHVRGGKKDIEDSDFEGSGLNALLQIKNRIRKPDLTVELYSLNVKAINEAFGKFRECDCNWSIWGSSLIRNKKTQNCSGLVALLLYKGGISKLIRSYAMIGRRGGALVGFMIIAIGGLINKINNKIPTKDFIVDYLLACGLVSLGGGLAGGALGGIIDGYKDAQVLVKIADALKVGYKPAYSFAAYLFSMVLNAISSTIGFDHATQERIIVAPEHIEYLIKFAYEAEINSYEYVDSIEEKNLNTYHLCPIL